MQCTTISLLYFRNGMIVAQAQVRLIWHIPTTVVCSVILYIMFLASTLIALVTFP